MRQTFITVLLISILIVRAESQSNPEVLWKGCVKTAQDSIPIPFATLASYMKVNLYGALEDGCFELKLAEDDSIRIAAIGFQPQTITWQNASRDFSGNIIVYLEMQSYQINEVTIRPEQKPIELNLPSDIGSQMSGVPPNERRERATGPVSLVYNLLGGGGPSDKDLERVRSRNNQFQHMEQIAGREVIENISGLEGEQLDRFIVYCNINLNTSIYDTSASLNHRILNLLEEFLEKEK